MPAKKIICPLCEESVVLGKPSKSGSYFCPSCHGEIVLQRSRKKVRERRSGVIVGGEVYGVKPPSESAFHDEPAAHVPLKQAPLVAEAERKSPPNREQDEDLAIEDEGYDECGDDVEDQEVVVASAAGARRRPQRDDEGDSRGDYRSPRHSRTSRNAARMAVAIVLLVLVGVVSAGVLWLQGVFGGSDVPVAESGPRLQIPVAGAGDEGSAERPSRGPERREVDVDRLLDSGRRASDSPAIPETPLAQPDSTPEIVDSQTVTAPPTPARQDGPSQAEIEAAAEVARVFLASSSAEERGRMIRNRQTYLPVMLEYYQRNPDALQRGGNLARVVTSPGDYPMIGFMVMFADGSERFIGLEAVDGGFRVDWPSFDVYHEREWRDFVENRVSSPTLVRVYASPVEYYNFAFNDPEEYYCLRLENGRNPYGDDPIYGYIRRDHEDYEKLIELAEVAGQFAMPLVLRINYPLLPQSGDQVEIVELISNGWMIRD